MIEEVAAAVAAASVNTSPLAMTTKKTVQSTRPKSTHPSTIEMIHIAVSTLNERGGSSLQAIKKYIAGTYALDPERLAPLIKKHIKAAVEAGTLVQTKGKGASGSFKLPAGKKLSEAAKTKKITKKSALVAKASPKKSLAVKKNKSSTETEKKPIVAKKATTKKPTTAEKSKKASAKSTEPKIVESPAKVKKVTKAPTSKPSVPKPKKLAGSKNSPKKQHRRNED